MSNLRHELDVTVAVRSPFLFQGLAVPSLGLDAAAMRDGRGRAIIPADHLRGLVRAALTDLSVATNGSVVKPDDIDAWLGAPSPANVNGEVERPNRGCLVFSDLVLDRERPDDNEATAASPTFAHRVQISRETGAADEGMLQTIELVCPPEEVAAFRGTIVAYLDDGELDRCRATLEKAMKLLPAMGALKSAGFGELVADECRIETREKTSLVLPKADTSGGSATLAGDTIEIDIAFDRPMLVAAQHVADNVFSGSSVVPGAAIKGAIARRYELAGRKIEAEGDPIGEALATVVIGHAWPLDDEGRLCERALPFSLAVDPTTDDEAIEIRDALLSGNEDPLLGFAHAPAWQTDWKGAHWAAVRRALGRPESEMAFLPRAHTAIGPDAIASDEQLFVSIARSHLRREGETWNRRHWRLRIHRNGGDEKAFCEIVEVLCSGLDGIGRTGARLEVVGEPRRVEGRETLVHSVDYKGGEAFIVLLETPAVMTDPWDARPVAEQYRDYFRWASGVQDLELLDHFTRRELAGGHVARRRRPWGAGTYHPFELTEPGSVFLLRGKLKDWLEKTVLTGLPAVVRRNGSLEALDWRACPFVPGNGYGAISADGRLLEQFRPKGGGAP